jgi:NADH-quinone oxidoreductase subunit J
MITGIAFYVFSAILLGSAAMVVTSRNPVHSVLFLILAFFNAAALFLIAGAEFLAMILVIVYVGAVAVLFLFVVMMLDIDFVALREGFQRYAPFGAVVGVVLFFELLGVLLGWQMSADAPMLRLSQMPGNLQNTRAIGQVLYTNYAYLFQIAGLILLVSMIGAIVLTHRDRRTARRQNITRQQERRVSDTLEVLQLRSRAGVQELGIYRPKPEKILLPANATGHVDARAVGHASGDDAADHEAGEH